DDSVPMCDSAVVTITVFAVNDAPVLVTDTATVSEDSSVTGTILTPADFDPDTTVLTVNIIPVLAPSHGSIIIDSIGNYTYTPDTNYYGPDTVVFSVCDSGIPLPAICVNDTLMINVLPVNDSPIIANDTISTYEDSSATGNILTPADSDPDSTILTVDVTPVSGPAHGSIVIDSSGNYTYTPVTNYNGLDTVVFSVCDAGIPLPAICVNDTL